MNRRFMVFAVLAVLLVLIYAYHQKSSKVSEADIKLISAKHLDSKINRLIGKERVVLANEPDAVSEEIAQSLIGQLAGWGKIGNELTESLYICSGIHASVMLGKKSRCVNDYSGDVEQECLMKRGYGRKSVGQVLAADRVDLNADGIPDYIISDRYYCPELSANQAQVYFVMLSKDKRNFRLAYADWTSFELNVIEDPTRGEKVLVEQAQKAYGTFSQIMHLVNGKYVPRVCIVEDEHGYAECKH